MATGRKWGMHSGVKPEDTRSDAQKVCEDRTVGIVAMLPDGIDSARAAERQSFIDAAVIALHAHAPGVRGHFAKAARLWDEREEWRKTQK